jgi:hypothetical protein
VEGRTAAHDEVAVAQIAGDQLVDHDLHVRHRGGQQRRHPEDVGLVLVERREVGVDVAVDADVDDLEPCAFHHHRYEILADVVDVALDGSDDDLPGRLGAGLGEQRPEDLHAGLHRVRRQQHLGDEQDAVAEVDADDGHTRHERILEHAVGRVAAAEQDACAFGDLVAQTVVEVIVHLRDQVVIIEAPQVEFIIVHRIALQDCERAVTRGLRGRGTP